ncbi:MAG: zinc ribbon domain-containing protein [Gammaproteobacteria bacterium]|nr:zinc ribbon domain-containing protein [Gammaproteobacteria bacterium]
MPIYEYICTECEHDHEALQKMSDAALVDCPACSEPALKKKISAPGFRLSGSGWYETDFKSDKQRNLAESGKKDGKKKEAKPAAKEPASKKDAAA